MKRSFTSKGLRFFLPLLLLCSVFSSRAAYTPVAVTGFNADIVANGVGAASSSTTTDVDGVNYNFVAPDFQATATSPLPTYALPATGTVNSVATGGLVFQLASYAADNALRIATQNGTGTLTFTTPQSAGEVYILGTSGTAATDVDIVVTFSDNSTQTFTSVNFPDWYGGSGFAIQGIGRVNRTNNNLEGNSDNPRLYQRMLAIDPLNYTKQIVSVTFTKTNSAGVLNVMGIATNDVCAGPPTSGTALASVSAVSCPTASFTLTLSGHTTGVGTTYEWQHSPAGANTWTSLGAATTNPNFTVAGQTGSTDYRALVTCTNGGASDFSAPVTVTSSSITAPWIETFESSSPTRTCWTVINANADTDEWVLNSTSYPHGGTTHTALYTDFNAGANDDWLITPPITLSSNQRLRYWYRVRSANEPNDYEVLLSTTGTSVTDFTTVLKPLTVAANTTYDEDTIDLSAYTGTVYIAFRVPPGGLDGWYLYFDDIQIEDIPSCPGPVNLLTSNITSTTADLDWTESGTATQWRIEYGPVGFTPGSGTSIVTSTKPYTLTGLSPNTQYGFYVTANCTTTDSGTTLTPGVFYTTQIPVTVFPWVEDFETGGTEWTFINGSQANKWFVGTAVANGGTQSLYVSNDGGTSNTYSTGTTSVTQAYRDINFTPGALAIDLSFDWRADGEGSMTGSNWDYLRVWIVPQTFTPTPGTQVTAANSGGVQLGGNLLDVTSFTSQSYVIPASFAGTNSRLIFEWRNDGGTGTQPPAAVDNVQITVGMCPQPSALTAGNMTQNSAEIGWTENGTATQWLIEYGPQGFTPGTGTYQVVTANPATVTGLNPNTNYSAYVSSICSSTDSSMMAGPVQFTTSQNPVTTFPWNEDFETGGTNWTMVNGTQPNKWVVGTATANGGTQSLYISNNGGVDNTYTLGTSSVTQVFRDVNFPATATAIDLSFDWKADGEGSATSTNYDYLRVWVVPQSFVPTPGTQITTSNSGGVQLGGNLLDQSSFNLRTQAIPATLAGTNSRLVFEWKNDGSGGTQPPAALDNIQIVIPSCLQPTSAAAANLTSNSADLSWTSSATLWEIEYGQGNFSHGTGTRMVVSSNPYTLTGLTPGSPHRYYVRAICAPGDTSSWSAPVNFTTSCPAFFTPNFMQDFSTYLPSCWEEQEGMLGTSGTLTTTGSDWTNDDWLNTGGTAKGQAAKINIYYTGKHEWLVSPSVDLGTGGNYYLQFNVAFLEFAEDYGLQLGSDDTLAVVISTDNGATWDISNALQIFTAANSGFTSAHVTVPLTSYTGVVKFGFYASEGVINDPEDVDVMIDNVAITSTPLSIELNTITAINAGLRNRIDWNTASEDAGDVFTLERSSDSRNFEVIATIDGKGEASSYSYWDEQPLPGVNYYRLRMTDANGVNTYSRTVFATVKGQFVVSAFPNPAEDQVTIKVSGTQAANASISLMDVSGKLVRKIEEPAAVTVIDLSEVVSGVYFVRYSDDQHTETIKLIKK